MRFVKYVAVFAMMAFGLSLSAYAKARNEGKFTLADPVMLGSTHLKPGDYKATWEGSGSDVQVTILHGKDVVATTSAKLADNPTKQDAIGINEDGGTKKVNEIDFAGARKTLLFGSHPTARP
jgi:hypothetical protein